MKRIPRILAFVVVALQAATALSGPPSEQTASQQTATVQTASRAAVLAAGALPQTSAPSTPPPAAARKVVYLTFDDGPSEWTGPVLRVLTKHRATATFFQLGVNVPRHPRARAAILAQGSTIGNHTRAHTHLTRLTNAQVRAELRGGPRSKCLRPPYGEHDARIDALIRAEGMEPVLWSADTRDWAKPGIRAIVRDGLLGLHPGSIILMHDGGGDRSQTVAALPKLLKALRAQGYTVRALPGC